MRSMGRFRTKVNILFFLRSALAVWLVWLFKENSYFAQGWINETIMAPKMQEIYTKWITKYVAYILLKFYMMANLFDCFGKLMFWNLCLVQNWHVSYFFYHLFAFHNSSSARVHSLYLFSYEIFFLKVYYSHALRWV